MKTNDFLRFVTVVELLYWYYIGTLSTFQMFLLERCYGSWLCSSSDIIGCYNTDRFLITFYFQCCTKNNFWISPVSSGCHTGLVFKGPHINPSHCH